jgi:hypothetical protein
LPVSLSFNAKIAPVLFKAKDEIPELFGKTAFSLVMLGWSNLIPKYDTAEPLLNAFIAKYFYVGTFLLQSNVSII